MLKISKAASLALHVMAYLYKNRDGLITNKEISTIFGASEDHIAKVLQRLSKHGLVESIRGPKGGFSIGMNPDSITMIDVYESVEGPLITHDCLLSQKRCLNDECVLMDGICNKINKLFKEYMTRTHLSELKEFHFPENISINRANKYAKCNFV